MAEPVSLATAKAHLRVTTEDEDDLITGYIKAAREWVENYTGHILVQREIVEHRDAFTRYFELRHRPIVSVDGIDYTDSGGASAVFTDFISTARNPVRIYPEFGFSWPTLGMDGEITLTYTAGYAAGEEPQELIQAMLVMIDGMYANRGSIPPETKQTAEWLCDQLRPVM